MFVTTKRLKLAKVSSGERSCSLKSNCEYRLCRTMLRATSIANSYEVDAEKSLVSSLSCEQNAASPENPTVRTIAPQIQSYSTRPTEKAWQEERCYAINGLQCHGGAAATPRRPHSAGLDRTQVTYPGNYHIELIFCHVCNRLFKRSTEALRHLFKHGAERLNAGVGYEQTRFLRCPSSRPIIRPSITVSGTQNAKRKQY